MNGGRRHTGFQRGLVYRYLNTLKNCVYLPPFTSEFTIIKSAPKTTLSSQSTIYSNDSLSHQSATADCLLPCRGWRETRSSQAEECVQSRNVFRHLFGCCMYSRVARTIPPGGYKNFRLGWVWGGISRICQLTSPTNLGRGV